MKNVMRQQVLTAVLFGALLIILVTGGAAATGLLQPPLPPPTPTPAPPGKAAPPDSFKPPGSVRPPYLVERNFAGRAIHWTQKSYSFAPNTPDSANGQEVLGDLWVRFGADGQPTNVHARYTLPDGSLHQEIVQDGSQETIIFAPADAPSKAGCRAAAPSSPARMRDSRPPFVDEAALPAAGFLRAGGLTAQPPVTRPLPGVRPALVHPSDPVANGWETKTVSSGITLASRFEVGSQGRLLAARTWRTDSTGLVLGETRAVYGPLEEYESAVVPSDVFALSAQAGELCRA